MKSKTSLKTFSKFGLGIIFVVVLLLNVRVLTISNESKLHLSIIKNEAKAETEDPEIKWKYFCVNCTTIYGQDGIEYECCETDLPPDCFLLSCGYGICD